MNSYRHGYCTYLFAFALPIVCLCGVISCALTPEQRQTLEVNALKDAQAAGLGYLKGGQAGALTGLTAQILINHSPLTSAKQPVTKVTP